MNERRNTTVLVILLVQVSMLLALASSDSDTDSLNELYENLLQREYTGPISYPDHQVERKAQRSPSLRLRFGRSDPELSPLGPLLKQKRFADEINKKPIRSPSLRLRFGRRDPSIPILGDDFYADDASLREEMHREVRKPAARLRWGRRSDPMMPLFDDAENELDIQPEKRKAVRLRWGRSYNPATLGLEFQQNTNNAGPNENQEAVNSNVIDNANGDTNSIGF